MRIEFGWVAPSGSARMPASGVHGYQDHLQHMLAVLSPQFNSLWLPDHFMHDQDDVLEAMTTLSFLAGLSTKLQLGTIVLGQSYRNPALLAKMAATIQVLSGGRFVLGIGAGWKQDEYQAYNYEFPPSSTRITQMAEAVEICRALWDPTRTTASFTGEHYRIHQAVCQPKPQPPPPIMIGGGGERLTLRVVANLADWWNLVGVTPQAYAHKITVLSEHCAAVGRNVGDIRKSWMGVVSIAPTPSEAEETIASYPLWLGDYAMVGTPDQIVQKIQQFTDLGIDLFQLSFADEPSTAGIDLFLEHVMTKVHNR